MRGREWATAAYVWTVIGVGVILLASHLGDLMAAPQGAVLFLVLMSLTCELVCVSVPIGEGTVSISMAVSMASMILHGPWVACWVSALGSFRPQDFTPNVSWRRRLFNPAQVALSTLAAGFLYDLLGGSHEDFKAIPDLVALLSAALAAGSMNIGLGVTALVLERGPAAAGMILGQFKAIFPSYLALAPFGLIGALLFREMGPWGVLSILLPLMLARYSFQRFRETRRTFAQTLAILITALEAKDRHTYGHSGRVARIAVIIGREMRLPDHVLHLLNCIGLLHDVGKIGVKDAVLKKEGVFTMEEYAEMQEHPATGADIIASIRTLGQAADWIMYHHERWDGAGFPFGLKGPEIPLGARIIAVADAFDAMTSFRPYKPAQTWQEALLELERCKGTQFDPAVVDAFQKAIRKITPSDLEHYDAYQLAEGLARGSDDESKAGPRPCGGRYDDGLHVAGL